MATCHNATPRNAIIAESLTVPFFLILLCLGLCFLPPLAPQRISELLVPKQPNAHRGVSSRILFGIEVPSR